MHSEVALQRRIGRYVLLDRLGRGAMGIVYRAQDPLINRTVAIKLLDIVQALSPDQAAVVHERFMREAQTAGNLDHPNIVKIYDVGRDDESGEFYIVMEYLPGPSLDRKLESKPFDPPATVDLIRQIASALDLAHSRGIIHRDIKPANILFNENGLAKITDFGIARITTSHLTQDVRDLGTPVFMSPEQVSGRPLDGRSDLFSLGVLAYQLLAGRPPFDGKNAVSLGYQIVHSVAPSVREAVPALPAALDDVMTKILAKDPALRYPTGRAFADALAAALGRTVAAPPARTAPAGTPSGSRAIAMKLPKNRLAIAGAAAAVVLLGVWMVARKPAERTPAIAAPPKPTLPPAATPDPSPTTVAPPTSKRSTTAPSKKEQRPVASARAISPAVPPDVASGEESSPSHAASASPPESAGPAHAPVERAHVVASANPAGEKDPALVAVTLGHWISRGTLTVFADGEPILVREFAKKKLLPYQTSAWDPIEVPAGVRQLTAKVTTPKGDSYVAAPYRVELVPGARNAIRLGFRSEVLSFKGKETGKDAEARAEKAVPSGGD